MERVTIKDLVTRCRGLGGSDIHIKVGALVGIRVNGTLMHQQDSVAQEDAYEFFKSQGITEPDFNSLDMAAVVSGVSCRLSIYPTRDGTIINIRLLGDTVPEFDNLGLPPQAKLLTNAKNGLVLISGSVGSGKTTTIAAMLNEINKERQQVILTIEDPVEIRHKDRNCIVIQREVGKDVGSYPEAIIEAMRQDTNVVMIGELRTKEAIEAALTLAETGQLVLATVHTNSLIEALDRLAGAFPIDSRDAIVSKLANVFRGGIHMRLIADSTGRRRPFTHILNSNNLIRLALVKSDFSTIRDTMLSNPDCYSDIESCEDLIRTGTIRFEDIAGFLTDDERATVTSRMGLERKII